MDKLYATDLTDVQWAVIEPEVVKKKRRGPKSRVDLRTVVNAIFYRLRTGCQWRRLPKEYPNWEKVSGYWQRWCRHGRWRRLYTRLREKVRKKAGKNTVPSVAIIDSQSVKTVQKGGPAGTMVATTTQASRKPPSTLPPLE